MKYGFFALLAVLCLAALPACAEGEVTFTFHPPEKGLAFIQTSKFTKTEKVSAEGESGTQVTVTTLKSRIQYVKTATGYTRTDTLISCEKTVDGQEQPDEFYAALIDMPVEMDHDAQGVITAIRGADAIVKRLLASLQEPQRSVFARIMTPEKFEDLSRADWAATYTPLYGVTKKPGDTWSATTRDMIFSSGLLPVKSNYTFLKADTALGRPCVQMKIAVVPNLKAFTADLRKYHEELGMFPKDAKPTFSVLAYTMDCTSSIDPQLLIPLKSTATETKKYTITFEGVKVTFEETEKSVTTSAYESVWRAEPV